MELYGHNSSGARAHYPSSWVSMEDFSHSDRLETPFPTKVWLAYFPCGTHVMLYFLLFHMTWVESMLSMAIISTRGASIWLPSLPWLHSPWTVLSILGFRPFSTSPQYPIPCHGRSEAYPSPYAHRSPIYRLSQPQVAAIWGKGHSCKEYAQTFSCHSLWTLWYKQLLK